MARQFPIEELQDLAKQRGGRCLSKVYTDSRTPLEWECCKKHRWLARPGNIKTGNWCPYCSQNGAVMLGKEGLLERCQRFAEKRSGRCLSTVYLTARKPLEWKCSEGHRWKATPDNIKRGKWCPECARKARQQAKVKYSVEECERFALERGGKLVKPDVDSRRNWIWECHNGHQWNASPSQVLGLETWCKRCLTSEARADKITESLLRRGIRIIKGTLKNTGSRLQMECEKGHRWETSLASVHLAKSGCPHCSGNVPLSLAEARKVAASKGGRCLSTVYRNARTKLLWECNKGHRWEATLGNVGGGQRGNGTWCRICCRTHIQAKYTHEDAVALAESRGGMFLSPSMQTVLSHYTWQCANGHTWEASFSSVHHGGTWCPSCSRHLGERLTRIAFETLFEYKFPTSRPRWLRSENGTQLSLDGYCETLHLAFEHQGEQHYSDKNYFGNTAEEQEKIRAYDELKQRLCNQQGVDLILVPEVPRLTPLETLRDFVIDACCTVGKVPSDPRKSVHYDRAYIEDGRLHRLHETAVARSGVLIEKTYFGLGYRYTWRCAEGHEWRQTAENVVRRGTWCPYCAGRHNITLKLLQENAREKGGEVLSTTYQNRDQKITCRCREGHVFRCVARSLARQFWCPECRR